MKWEDKGIKTELGRARGLGSAKHGSHHWLMQRITAIANIPLAIWMIYSVVHMAGATHAQFTQWLSYPLNAILMILFIVTTFYHAALGAQVVTEDYIHSEGLKLVKLIAQKLFFIALGIACIFSILKIAL